MKLYATTTSERGKAVSKSGNDFIEIEVTANKQVIAILRAFESPYKNTKENNTFIVQWLETDRQGKKTGVVLHGEVRGVKQ